MPGLAACGSTTADNDGSVFLADPLTDLFSDGEAVVNACASNYYTELDGNYDGQIDYISDDESLECSWEVDLQVTGEYISDPINRTVCDLTMNMISTSANTDGCSDVGLAGDIAEPLKDPSNIAVWQSPSYPIDATALLDVGLPGSAVYPIGEQGPTSVLTFRFDGRGNVTYPASIDGSWTGVLVKQ